MTDRGEWMQTFTGRVFYPLDPRPEDIDPLDIAHALSMLCRYGGHTSVFYCPTPDQRVLTADLRWVPAGDLRVGDELLGFDETPHEPGTAGRRRRRFRHATVLTAMPVKRRVIRLVMADGSTVRSSAEHPWLVATKQSRNQSWATAGDLMAALAAGRRRYMHRFVTPWESDRSWSAGWLAGILDGEGHISLLRTGVQFGVAQRPGLVLKGIEAEFDRLGLAYAGHPVGISDVLSLQILGGWREMARMIGTVRPVRLLDKFVAGLRAGHFDKHLNGVGTPPEIVAAYDEGEEWVTGLETSTRTYLCEGYGAHNSVAEHCVLMSEAVSPANALWALLHDATEAYMGDMIRPLKRAMAAYQVAEDYLMSVIAVRFGLDPTCPAEVKDADNRILADERDALMKEPPLPWTYTEGRQPLGVPIAGWDPAYAERRYLSNLEFLTGQVIQ